MSCDTCPIVMRGLASGERCLLSCVVGGGVRVRVWRCVDVDAVACVGVAKSLTSCSEEGFLFLCRARRSRVARWLLLAWLVWVEGVVRARCDVRSIHAAARG